MHDQKMQGKKQKKTKNRKINNSHKGGGKCTKSEPGLSVLYVSITLTKLSSTARGNPKAYELKTILQQICHIAMPEPNISTCPDVGMWQIYVCWWCSLVVFGAGVRVVEFGTKRG